MERERERGAFLGCFSLFLFLFFFFCLVPSNNKAHIFIEQFLILASHGIL